MAWQLSASIEDALWTAAERMLPRRAYTGRVLREAIIARSRRYTSEREFLDEPPARGPAADADLAARALFFTPADAGKLFIPLSELDRVGLMPRAGQLSVIDAGAGVGAMTLGLLDYLHQTGALTADLHVRVRAIDRDARALELMRAVVDIVADRLDARVSLTVEGGDIGRLVGPVARGSARESADLVLAGTLLNELPADARSDVVRDMVAAVRPAGAAIVLEPALRATARELHRVRDWLISNDLCYVFAPCTRASAPCPALEDERDWCHEDRATSLTPRTASLAGATGLRVHGLKFAYLTLRREPGSQVASGPGDQGDSERAAVRVVSRPRRQKGMRECFVCGAGGRVRIRLLKRNKSENNSDFARARRGDVLLLPARLTGGGDLSADDPVEHIGVDPP